MSTWLSTLINVVMLVALSALTRKKRPDNRPTIEDINFPTATEDRVVPVVWGRAKIFPNCTWAGDFYAEQKHKKVPVDMFGLIKEKVPVGYHYYAGMQLVLAHGQLFSIDEVWIEKRKVWDTGLLVNPGGQQMIIDSTWREPGEEIDNGVHAIVDIIANPIELEDPHVSAYLAEQLGEENTPAGVGLTYAVWRGPSSPGIPITVHGFEGSYEVERPSGFFGSRTTVPPIAFVVTRYPELTRFFDAGGFYGFDNTPSGAMAFAQFMFETMFFPDGGTNPAWALAELLTNPTWGAGVRGRALDQTSFCVAAQRLKDEGLSFSYAWQEARPISEIIELIEQHCNGTLRRDPKTGRWQFKLSRVDDEPVYALTPSNITDMREITRTATDEAINEVKVPYVDSESGYIERVATAKDPAGVEAAGGAINSIEISFPGAQTAELATTLAMRELRARASSLVHASLTAAVPPGTLLQVGDVVTLEWPPLGIESMRLRVQRARYNDALTSAQLDLVQDIFLPGNAFYVSPGPTPPAAEDGLEPITKVDNIYTINAPYALTGDDADHVLSCSFPPIASNSNAVGYVTEWSHVEEDSLDAIEPSPRTYAFAVSGVLNKPVLSRTDRITVRLYPDAMAEFKRATRTNFFAILGPSTDLERSEWIQVGIALVEEELSDGSGVVALTNIKRGLFDTVPRVFSASTNTATPGNVVMLFDYAIDARPKKTDVYARIPDTSWWKRIASLDGDQIVKVRALGLGADGRIAEPHVNAVAVWSYVDYGDTTQFFFNRARAAFPLPPAGVQLNGTYGIDWLSTGFVSGETIDPELIEPIPTVSGSGITLTWFPRQRTQRIVPFHSTGDPALDPGCVMWVRITADNTPDKRPFGTKILFSGELTSNDPIEILAEDPDTGEPVLYDGDVIVVSIATRRYVDGAVLASTTYRAVWQWSD